MTTHAKDLLSEGCRDWLEALAEEGPAMDYAREIIALLSEPGAFLLTRYGPKASEPDFDFRTDDE